MSTHGKSARFQVEILICECYLNVYGGITLNGPQNLRRTADCSPLCNTALQLGDSFFLLGLPPEDWNQDLLH